MQTSSPIPSFIYIGSVSVALLRAIICPRSTAICATQWRDSNRSSLSLHNRANVVCSSISVGEIDASKSRTPITPNHFARATGAHQVDVHATEVELATRRNVVGSHPV
uniref:Uncharacterized protein n=1 Tax=Anopheles culicifacies TaxID=139723 RepID=A0A182MBV2_9DIPT